MKEPTLLPTGPLDRTGYLSIPPGVMGADNSKWRRHVCLRKLRNGRQSIARRKAPEYLSLAA